MVHYWAVERGRGYGRWRCRRCSGEAVLKRKQWVRRLLVLEAGDRCQSCGYDRCRKNLHFHHIDPATKGVRDIEWQWQVPRSVSGRGKEVRARLRELPRRNRGGLTSSTADDGGAGSDLSQRAVDP